VDQHCTILIADRNPRVRELLKRELASEGYDVRCARNAQEVMEQVFSHEMIHLLILDPDLPDMGGVSLVSALESRFPHLPVIILTLHDSNEESLGIWPQKIIVEKNGNSVEEIKRIIHTMEKS